MQNMQALVGWILVGVGLLWLGVNLRTAWREIRFLRGVLSEIVPLGRIQKREDLVAIKNYLSSHISYNLDRKEARRPLLRHSATHILRSGYGFCGENARVAINLLFLGGVRANRLYLEGPRWKHVVIEHQWDGDWKLFDSHNDPTTIVPDESIARISSDDLDAFPNDHRGINPWTGCYRSKAGYVLGNRCKRFGTPLQKTFQRLAQQRLPCPVIVFFENPALVRALGGALLAGIGALLILL
jgi:hypothetical protein